MPYLTEQTTPWFGTPFTTSGQETEQAVFFQPQSMHGALNNELTLLGTGRCLCDDNWPTNSASDSSSESRTDTPLWPSLSAVTDTATVGPVPVDCFPAADSTTKYTSHAHQQNTVQLNHNLYLLLLLLAVHSSSSNIYTRAHQEMRYPNVTWRIILSVYLFTTEQRHTCNSRIFF